MTDYHARVAAVRARNGIPHPRHPYAARLWPAAACLIAAAALADHWQAGLLCLPAYLLGLSAFRHAERYPTAIETLCPDCSYSMDDMWGQEADEIPLADRRPCDVCHRIDY